ncbi:MAG: histidine phosphatase family protein [Paracoccaceae bacterium]
MRRATLLRHPRVAAAGLCYGRADVALAATAEAEIAAALVTTPPVRAVVASPSLRARALAEPLAARDGVALTLDPRLAELDFGAWEGRPWAEIDRAESDPWAEDPETRAPPGGERFADLRARVRAALADLPEGAAVVAHAGPIRAARMIVDGWSFEAAFAWAVPYAVPIALEGASASIALEGASASTSQGGVWPTSR